MNTITTPSFMVRNAKIIAEIRTRLFIDGAEAEVIADIFKEQLNEECMILDGYYKKEYFNALNRARSKAYDDGYKVGYEVGYDKGRSAV